MIPFLSSLHHFAYASSEAQCSAYHFVTNKLFSASGPSTQLKFSKHILAYFLATILSFCSKTQTPTASSAKVPIVSGEYSSSSVYRSINFWICAKSSGGDSLFSAVISAVRVPISVRRKSELAGGFLQRSQTHVEEVMDYRTYC